MHTRMFIYVYGKYSLDFTKKKSNYNLKIFIYEEYIVYKLVYNEIHITKVGHAAINICEENK